MVEKRIEAANLWRDYEETISPKLAAIGDLWADWNEGQLTDREFVDKVGDILNGRERENGL